MAMPKLPPDVEKIGDESQKAFNALTDKRRNWIAVLAIGGLMLVVGFVLGSCVA